MARKKLSDYVKSESPITDSDIDAVGNNTESSSGSTPFLPSIFDQLDDKQEMASRPVTIESPEKEIELNAEDIEMVIELPFDAAAQFTKWPGWSLSEKETKALSKLWIKPFRTWLKDVENLDIYLAALVTVTVLGEKFIGYKVEQQERAKSSIVNNSSGDAGIRQDEFREVIRQ